MDSSHIKGSKLSHKANAEVQQLSAVNFPSNRIPSASPNSLSPPSSNCSQQPQTPSSNVVAINKNGETIIQQRQQQIIHQTQIQEDSIQKYGYRAMYNGYNFNDYCYNFY